MDWFLYDNGLRHQRVNYQKEKCSCIKHVNLRGFLFDINVSHVFSIILAKLCNLVSA